MSEADAFPSMASAAAPGADADVSEARFLALWRRATPIQRAAIRRAMIRMKNGVPLAIVEQRLWAEVARRPV